MEGANVHAAHGLFAAQPRFQARAHFFRRLARESHSGDFRALRAANFHEVSDALHQGEGFARARPRDHRHMRRGCLHGLALRFVQALGRVRLPLRRFRFPRVQRPFCHFLLFFRPFSRALFARRIHGRKAGQG